MICLMLAAGLGTRLQSLTADKPKALVPLHGVPLLEYNIKHLASQGVRHFVINVHHYADQVESFLAQHHNFGLHIQVSDERSLLLDTGGAIRHAAPWLQGHPCFLVHNVDIVSRVDIRQLYQYHLQHQALASLVVQQRHSSRQLLFDSKQQLCAWENTLTHERKTAIQTTSPLTSLAFGGIHMLSASILNHLDRFGQVFSIIDAYLALAAHHPIVAYNATGVPLIDVGKPDSLRQAEQLF